MALSYSQSDTGFYDGYGDLTGLDPARTSNVTLDILGGVRLTTVGVPVTTTWTNQADFVTPEPPLLPVIGPVIGLTTLDTATAPGSLQLAQTPLAFRRGSTEPILAASPAVSADGYSVGGMCVARVDLPDAVYYMWYTGVPENGWEQRLFLAKSNDGKNWTKEPLPVNLPLGDPGSFDSRQIFRPAVIYDAAAVDPNPKFKMWYSAEGDFGGSIGYATSNDGVTWTKVLGPDGLTNEVLPKGDPGTADGLSCAEPSVLLDGSTYHMWYTASDGNNDRIAYATSSDGITWQKGSVVVDILTGNTNCGANSPTVWKTDTGFSMILAGCKIPKAGDPPEVKLIAKDSPDGTDWSQGNIALNFPNNAGDWFDLGTQTQPWVLPDPTDTDAPFKMWYVGSNPDGNGNFHNRIGYAESDRGGSFSGIRNPAGAIEPFYGAWLTLGDQSDAFDSMNTADLRPVPDPAAPTTDLLGFYTGVNAIDFKPRIGLKRSTDGGATWTNELAAGASLFSLGGAGAADEGGAATPAPFYLDGATPRWIVYYTAANGAIPAEQSIGYRITTDDTLATISSTYQPFLTKSLAGFDSAGVADPYVIDTGSALAVYYAGKSSGGAWSIGRVTAGYDTPQTAAGRAATALTGLTPTAGSYDAGGLRAPVVLFRDATWYLWYTAIDAFGTERTALATSTDGATWTKQGLAVSPSSAAYDFTEGGVRPAAAWDNGAGVSMTVTGIDRFGWTRCGLATASGPGFLESGTAAFELMNPGPRDWRQILWTGSVPTGTTSEIWVSYYPTANGDWSNSFQLTNGSALPFLLDVQALRWQVRMTTTDPLATPRLDDLSVSHAPVVFPASGQAVTLPVGPPAGRYLLSWGDLTIKAETSGSAGLSVTVQDAGGVTLVPARALNGATTIALGSLNPPVSATSGPLSLVFAFTSDTLSTARLESVGVSFASTNIPSSITLAASVPAIAVGQSATLAGVLTANSLPAAGQTVAISGRTPLETAFTPIGTAITLADGSFSLAVAPAAITLYRAEWAGGTVSGVVCPPAGAFTQLNVSPAIAMKLTNYTSKRGSKYRYPLGRAVIITGTMLPNHYRLADGVTPGTVVATLSKYAYNKTTRRYVWVKMKDIVIPLTSTGAFKKSWRPRVRAKYSILPSFMGDADHAAGSGKQAIVTVY